MVFSESGRDGRAGAEEAVVSAVAVVVDDGTAAIAQLSVACTVGSRLRVYHTPELVLPAPARSQGLGGDAPLAISAGVYVSLCLSVPPSPPVGQATLLLLYSCSLLNQCGARPGWIYRQLLIKSPAASIQVATDYSVMRRARLLCVRLQASPSYLCVVSVGYSEGVLDVNNSRQKKEVVVVVVVVVGDDEHPPPPCAQSQ